MPESDEDHTTRLLKVFEGARLVVVADAVEVKHSPFPGDPTHHEVIEEASMAVREVLKGPVKVGDRVAIRTELIGGACTMSVKNDPVWLYDGEAAAKGIDKALEMSGRWLLFAFDEKPLALVGGISAPWETVGEIDAERLRVFLKTGQKVVYPEAFNPSPR